MKDAENKADRWISDANNQVAEIKRELGALTTLRKDYEVKFRILLESHQEQLDAMRSTDREGGEHPVPGPLGSPGQVERRPGSPGDAERRPG